ncbi:eukaryotic translation initiation factor 4G isoform X3 [Spinacia oleracea]|uniref:Eukaryotic translation initiation factor 4G n=1 Tax=Spinacia oleracea TaxID=3562 RepID=A0A9R0JJ03_SPIOL|nr:eukaryotic translation initiation factor 4G-like isoform X3 [Spinacia oleracea]
MSQNQIRVEKKEKQYRKTGGGGRLNNTSSDHLQRSLSATGRPASPVPPLSRNNRSLKKSNNGQGGKPGGKFGPVSPDPIPAAAGFHCVENGNHVQSTLHAVSSAPAAAVVSKPADTSSQKSSQPIPKAPSSQLSTMISDSTLPSTPSKGEAGKGFSLQFGSISPGVMNGMQVPARTSSAPPNLDVQKRDQVQPAAARAPPAIPVSYSPKHQVPEMSHTASKITKDLQVSQATSVPSPVEPTQTQKPAVIPMPGKSMPLPYQQQQQQIQPQGTPNISLQMQMQMPLHIRNPPQVQQQVFVPGLQHNHMQNQGIVHQGQNFGFNPQFGPQLPHQTANLGMNLSPQFKLQHPVNVGSTRKVVKITHPETHEELRLGNRDGGSPRSRPPHMGPPQSQPVRSYTSMHSGGYYSNSYTTGPPIFPAPNSLSLSTTQLTANSQGPRFNYPITQAPPTMPFMNQSASNSLPNGKAAHGILEPPLDLARNVRNALPSVHSTSPATNIKAAVDSAAEKGTDSYAIENVNSHKLVLKRDIEVNANDSSCVYAPTNTDVIKKEDVVKLDSTRDVQKEHLQSSPKVHGDSAAPGCAEAAKSNISLGRENDVSLLKESHVSTGSGSTDLGVEKVASKDQDATQNGHLLQDAEQQGEKEVEGMEPGSALKSMDFVKTEQCDEFKKFDHEAHGFEASQGQSESSASGTEGEKAALQTSPTDNVLKSMSDKAVAPASANLSEEVEIIEKERSSSSSCKTKNSRGKKKRKEMLQKADSVGTNSDLYMAYKGPEDKKETVTAGEGASRISLKIPSQGVLESSARKKDEQNKLEFEDWEDAIDVSATKLESSVKGSHHDEGALVKKYSRDFLLTISEQCTDLPELCQIMPDIADILFCFNANVPRSDRDYSSSGRSIDRASGAARNDRRVNGMVDAGRWNKQGPHSLGRDPGLDLAYGGNMIGYQSGPGMNYGVLRNPRGHGPVQHAGGILCGPMGFQRNNQDADRWQRATSFDKGLMPAPAQVMHRADNKYEVGKVSDEEQAKQRRLKAILNKLTPQNFEKLFEQVKQVNIDNAVTLTGVISQIFDKALTEPTFCEMYANFCSHLASELPDLSVYNEKITFKRLLLNKCQEEFERGEREEEEANKDDGESEIKQTEEERERKRLKARRLMLGNIRLIGELYKKRMLTERIMHECIKKLLGQYQNADEENIEALCKLMSTIGEMIDHPRAKEHMDAYFEIMGQLSNNMKHSSRVRFMLKDAIDLRKNKWQQRMKVEGPKKIEEVHRDAAQERLGQAGGRLSRGNSGMRRGQPQSQPVEYGHSHRGGPMLPCPVGHRGFGSQVVGGYGGHDERVSFESRSLSVGLHQPQPQPQPQRDEPITLGPQGGLARGMSCRGHTSISISPSTDTNTSIVSGGFTNASDRGYYYARKDQFTRQMPVSYDTSLDKSVPTSSPVAQAVAAPAESIASQKVWPEERLRDMSVVTIKEYYSANDEKEVALCIKDLNAPKLYPSVISIWVTDAFERKDLERDMLAKLLISLTKPPRDSMFSPQQLIEGFDSVLRNLEDTVTDAPKAPEFLGQIFGKVILENVLSLKEVGRLIHKGGEEPGRLVEIGLGGDILGSVLDTIKSTKGESMLNEIRTTSTLLLQDFRPPPPLKSKKLEMFIT